MVEEETGSDGPKCPNCSSEDVAIRGSQSARMTPPVSPPQVWQCKKCGLVFAHRPGLIE
jgi:ribosomal protein L37AE/L43A